MTKDPSVWSNRLSSYILFIVIGSAPLPFGSRNAVTVAIWCGLLGLGLAIASSQNLRRPHVLLLAGVGLIVAGYAVVLHAQLAAHPWIAPFHPIWDEAASVLGLPLKPSVSIVRYEPFYALGPSLAAILALTLGIVVGVDRQRARQTLLVVAWSGVGYAAFGIVSLVLEPTMVLWREKMAYVGDLTGTFVNRNTAAAYFGSASVVWLLLLLERVRQRLPTEEFEWRTVPDWLLYDTNENKKYVLLPFLMLFVCLAALFLTRSRAGAIISLFAMVLAFALFFRRHLPRGKRLAVVLIGAGAVALVLMQLMGGGVSQRFEVQGIADEGRISGWRSTLRIIADHPWFGIGLGTFPWEFPAYRNSDVSMWGVWDRAHSTPLEVAAELGVPLALAIATGWLVILVTLWRGARTRKRDRIVPLAAFSVSTVGLLHSCVDFSLQVVGYSIGVFGLAGVGLAQSFHNQE